MLKPIKLERLAQALEKVSVEINVFLAGPNIDVTKDPSSLSDSDPAYRAKQARHFLYSQLARKYANPPVLGENEHLIAAGADHFGGANNLALSEIHLVRGKGIDAIIIFPSSAGSFCEFGLFSAYKDVCEKMLVLIDGMFSVAPGYLHRGPSALAAYQQARVENVDYANHLEIWSLCEDFLNQITQRKLVKQALSQ